MKRFFKTTAWSFLAFSSLFLTVADAADLKSVKTLKAKNTQLINITARAKNVIPTMNRMARTDAAFKRAIIADLEKKCGGKAKQDKNCTSRYVNSINRNKNHASAY